MSNHYDEPMENGMLLRTFSAKNHTAVCSEILMGFLNEHGGFTVRGFGDYLNIPGQWSGMVSAAVTLKSFFGLQSDGTVIGCGTDIWRFQEYLFWRDVILLQAEQDFLYGVTADGRVLIDGISDDTPEKAEFLQIVRSWQNVKYIEISSLFSLQAAALTYDGNLLYFRECIGGKYIDNYSDMWQRGAYTEVHFAGAGIAALEESGYVLMYSAVDKEVSRLDESLWYDIVHLSSRGGSTVIFGIRRNGELVYDYQKTVFSPAGKSWTRAEFAKYTPLKNVVAVTHTQSYAAVVTESGKVFLAGFLLTDDSPILSAHVLMNTRTDLVYTDFMEIALSAFNDPAAMADYVRSHMNAVPDNPMRQNEESYQKSSHCEKERLEQERMQKEQLEKERLEKEQMQKERLEKERLEKEQMQKERLEKEQLVIERRRLNVCQYCGGSFKGLFIKVCSRCGIKKDY